MIDKKPTFKDPQTGEEIESTWLARVVGGLGMGLAYGLFLGLVILLMIGSLFGKIAGWIAGMAVLVSWVFIFVFSVYLIGVDRTMDEALKNNDIRRVHDAITRTQHHRRQRLLKRKLLEEEWAGVPDHALSQTPPPGPPQPTEVSLSHNDTPEEEKPRLSEAVEEESRKGWWQTIQARWRQRNL